MKKNYLLVGLLTLGMAVLQGCKEDPEVTIVPIDPDLNGQMEELTPSAQKTRLQDVGLEFVNAIEAENHQNLIDVIGYIGDKYGNYDIDEDYVDKLEALYKETRPEEEDYHIAARKANPVAAMCDLMSISLNAAQKGAQLAGKTEYIYTSVLKAGLKDLYGGFKPDEKYGMWAYDKNVTDRLEVEFTDDHNQKWVATLKGSKETTRIHVTVYDKNKDKHVYEGGPDDGTTTTETYIYDDKYTLDIPKNITFTVKCNGTAIVDLTVNSSLAFEWTYNEDGEYITYNKWYEYSWSDGGYYEWSDTESDYNSSIDIDYTNLNVDGKLVVNDYEETLKSYATKSGITASTNVKIDGKSMLTAEASLNADIDNIIKQINDAVNVEDEDDIKINGNVVKDFSMYIDILGKVQIVGKCNKFEDLFDALMDLEEAEDEDDFNKYQRNLSQINNIYSLTVHYDKKETVQANIELEAYERYDEWDPSYTWFDVLPILVFAEDGSRFSFEDYFTESSFSDLIAAAEDLAEKFEDLFDDYFEEEDEPIFDNH